MKTTFGELLGEKDTEIDGLSRRNKHLEGLRRKYPKGTYSIEEYDAQVQAGISEEIQKQIKRGVEKLWQTEKPVLILNAVKNELKLYPEKCLPETRSLVDNKANKARDILLRSEDSWPPWFVSLYNDKIQSNVKNGLDARFYTLVEEKSQQETNRKVNIEWPNYVRNYMTPRFQSLWRAELMKLTTVYRFSCDRCGLEMDLPLTADTLACLIQQPNLVVQCLNPNCRDLLWSHKIPINLGQVLYTLTKKS